MRYCIVCKGKEGEDKEFRGQLNTCRKCESEVRTKKRNIEKAKPENDFFNSIVCKPIVRG